MRRSTDFLAIIVLACFFAPLPAAWAQSPNIAVVLNPPQVETVIVTAPKWLGDHPQTVIQGFVKSYALASPVSEEITRWAHGICPATHGLSKAEYNDFVTARMREIAYVVGAPAQTSSCRHNIDVIFTDKPQDFLDQVRRDGAGLLGPRPSRAEIVGTMRYPVQAWYATGTRDINNMLLYDDQDYTFGGPSGLRGMPERHIEGSLIRTGLRSELEHIYIIADTSKTSNFPLGAVADYVAVLALSQTQSFDACKTIPSITNLVSSACGADLKPTAITDTDLAFLKAVYSMDPGASFFMQESYISHQIGKALKVE